MNMSVESYTGSHSSRPTEVVEMGGRNRQLTCLLGTMAGNERLILQVGQNGRGTQDNRLSTGGVTGKITWCIITATTNHSLRLVNI